MSILDKNKGDVACRCGKRDAEIEMRGYAMNTFYVCRLCALQLARKLLEDLCELKGDRHG